MTKLNFLTKSLLSLVAVAFSTLQVIGSAEAQTKLNNQSLPGKQVWVHHMGGIGSGAGGREFDVPGGAPHGDLYPLEFVASETSPNRNISKIQRMLDSGINAVQVWFVGSDPSGLIGEWLTEADKFNGTFKVAPCLEAFGGEDEAVTAVTKYAAVAANHPNSAAKLRLPGENFDRLVIYVFGPTDNATTMWQNVRSRLKNAGIQTYFLGVLPRLPYSADDINRITSYFPIFDASWVFSDHNDEVWNKIIDLMNQHNRPYAGGVMPGTDRESPWGAYTDAEATAKYRREWQLSLASSFQWNNVVSWNDTAERHEVRPSSNWNWTRADITAFYSAKMRGTSYPSRLSSPQLYVTTAQSVRLGEYPRAEALVLNTSSSARTVKIQLVDGNGKNSGSPVSASVVGNSAGAVTIPSTFKLSSYPAKRFFRARAYMYDGAGKLLQQVTSAPIVVYNQTEVPTPMLRRLYYSIPAYKALPGSVSISMSGNPNNGDYQTSGATATVTPPSGTTVRFAEVLQNLRQVKNFFNTSPYTTSIPLENGSVISGWESVSAEAHGFYVGRVIDNQERVGYSDPIYVAPPSNLVTNPGFESGMSGWSMWSPNNSQDAASTGTSAHSGGSHGMHKKDSAYDVYTYQTITGLSNGKYTLKAWIRNTGGQTQAHMEAKKDNDDNAPKLAPLPKTGDNESALWRLITISDIDVTNGQCVIGFYSVAPGGKWIQFDDVQFYKQPI